VCDQWCDTLEACSECYSQIGKDAGRLRFERDDLKVHLDRSKELVDSLRGERAKNELLRKEVLNREQHLSVLGAENAKLKTELERAKIRIKDFESTEDQNEAEVDRLRAENARLRVGYNEHTKSMGKTPDETYDLLIGAYRLADSLTLTNARLIEERDQANARRQEAQESVEEWREKFHEMETDRNNWEKLAREWKAQCKKYKEKLSKFRDRDAALEGSDCL
jgi:chromosome segregation ATPase